MNEIVIKKERWMPYIWAIRPKTLTAACVPIIVGSCLAYSMVGELSMSIAFFALLSSLCIQIGTNFVNDALDFKKGADTATRIGPKRVTQSGALTVQQVLIAGLLFFFLAFLFGIPLILKGGWSIGILLMISILCGYLYTGGPMPLAYHGLGDLFVLLFFGLASTMAVVYLQTEMVTLSAFLAGLQIGLLATVIIAINNLRDRIEDAKVNKCTLAVRYGVTFARTEITLLISAALLLNPLWLVLGYSAMTLLPFVTAPLGLLLIYRIWTVSPSPIYNQYLALAALLHLLFGILLSASIIWK